MKAKVLRKLMTNEQLSKELTMPNYEVKAALNIIEAIDEVLFCNTVNDAPGVMRFSETTIQQLSYLKKDYEIQVEKQI